MPYSRVERLERQASRPLTVISLVSPSPSATTYNMSGAGRRCSCRAAPLRAPARPSARASSLPSRRRRRVVCDGRGRRRGRRTVGRCKAAPAGSPDLTRVVARVVGWKLHELKSEDGESVAGLRNVKVRRRISFKISVPGNSTAPLARSDSAPGWQERQRRRTSERQVAAACRVAAVVPSAARSVRDKTLVPWQLHHAPLARSDSAPGWQERQRRRARSSAAPSWRRLGALPRWCQVQHGPNDRRFAQRGSSARGRRGPARREGPRVPRAATQVGRARCLPARH
jgi:hypothetical protein